VRTSIAEGARIEARFGVRGGGVPLPAGDGVPSAPPEKIFGLFNVKMAYFGVFLRYLFESTGLQHKAV